MNNDKKDDILQKSNMIFSEIEKKKKIFTFVRISKNDRLIKQCKRLFMLRIVTIRSIQMGYYKRALRCLMMMQHILCTLEKYENEIQNKITEFMMDQNQSV